VSKIDFLRNRQFSHLAVKFVFFWQKILKNDDKRLKDEKEEWPEFRVFVFSCFRDKFFCILVLACPG